MDAQRGRIETLRRGIIQSTVVPTPTNNGQVLTCLSLWNLYSFFTEDSHNLLKADRPKENEQSQSNIHPPFLAWRLGKLSGINVRRDMTHRGRRRSAGHGRIVLVGSPMDQSGDPLLTLHIDCDRTNHQACTYSQYYTKEIRRLPSTIWMVSEKYKEETDRRTWEAKSLVFEREKNRRLVNGTCLL